MTTDPLREAAARVVAEAVAYREDETTPECYFSSGPYCGRHSFLEHSPLINSLAAALAQPNDLSAAWAEAEAALPEGWQMGLHATGIGLSAACAYSFGQEHDTAIRSGHAVVVDTLDGPAAALRALAARLSEKPR